MEESSGTKPNALEQVSDIVTNGRCTKAVQLEDGTAEDVQNASAEANFEEYVSIDAKKVCSVENSTKLPFTDSMKFQADSSTAILSSPKQIMIDHTDKFGSEMVNDEAMQKNHANATENIDNRPIKDQKSDLEHIHMKQEGAISEDVFQNTGLESLSSPIDNRSREKVCEVLLGLSPGDAEKDCKDIQLGQQIHNAGLEQLGPGQDTSVGISSQLGDGPKKTRGRGRPRKVQNSPASIGESVKLLPERLNNTQELLVNKCRSLRSRSQEKFKEPEFNNIIAEEGADRETKRKKRGRPVEKNRVNEFSRIRTHLRYLLHRIEYEKNLLDAYSGEGWKGQSVEKLKPEKELQRAKSEILRRKLKIRDLFQRLDSSRAEGRIPETLFDSRGEIDCEDIFCARCGSKDVTLSNDIILCDGACERGFHQFCLDPPLLKEHIPPGDEGWLCPGCECKIDCIKLLNYSQGTHISVVDSWEKVFAEESAAAAAGKNLDDNSGLPSDDSEDDDYDPDCPDKIEKVPGDDSSSDQLSSDEYNYHSASENLRVIPQKEPFLQNPSDDSEDGDYDPSGLDTDQKNIKGSSCSDFTSDSEDVSVLFDDSKPSGKVQESPSSTANYASSNNKGCAHPVPSDHASLYPRRRVKTLDYKKLNDEEYGNTSSDSSDEEYMETGSPNRKKYYSGKKASVLPNLESIIAEHGKESDDSRLNQEVRESTHKRRYARKFVVGDAHSSLAKSPKDSSAPASSGKNTSKDSYGEHATKRLLQSFKENQYPVRVVKESLATELSLSVEQVSKWFDDTRCSFRHSSHMACDVAEFSSDKSNSDRGVTEGYNRDLMLSMVLEEGNGHKPCLTKTRKRKAIYGSKATEPSSSLETPMQNVEVNSPKTQEMRKSSRIQSKSEQPTS